MSSTVLRLAVWAVRLWTHLYTAGLPPDVREARRVEVESDLWESVHDPDNRVHLPLHITVRLLSGMPDDLGWRFDQDTMTRSFRRRAALTLCLAGLLGCWLVLSQQRPDTLPRPDAPRPAARVHVPPPPPPPPPSRPDGPTEEVVLLYGQTSYVTAGATTTPTRTRHQAPVYPPVAVWSGVEGVVAVQATVDERGRVSHARVVEPAHWVLNQSALAAVRAWEFEPTIVDGAPVPVVITAKVSFSQPR